MDLQTTSQPSETATPATSFSPDNYLLNIFRRARANHQDIRVTSAELGGLTVLTSRNEYFTDNCPDLAALLCQNPKDCRIRVMAENDPRRPDSSVTGRNIDELLWLAAFHPSAGRLMQGCNQDDVIQLDSWPNLTRLPHTPNTFRILALLSKHPTSVFFASRLLKVPASELYQVYSSAKAAGLVRVLNRRAEEPKLEPHRNQSLLSSLLKKVSRR